MRPGSAGGRADGVGPSRPRPGDKSVAGGRRELGPAPSTPGEKWALAALALLLGVTILWWAFALWPVDGDAAPVLERARAVCFGTDPATGLPDATGWALLLGQPLLMGSFLLLVWGQAVRTALARLAGGGRGRAVLASAATVVLLGITLAGWRVTTAMAGSPAWMAEDALDDAVAAAVRPRLDREAPALELVSHRGEEFSLDQLRGGPVLLTFAYGHCVTICPLVVRNALEASVQSDEDPAVVVVTLDPWRDTPSRLPGVAERWDLTGEDHWLLGGEPDRVGAVLDAWGVPRTRDERTGEITHPALTFVLDSHGLIAFASRGSVESLVGLLERVNADPGTPPRSARPPSGP
jgi:protein SCO1